METLLLNHDGVPTEAETEAVAKRLTLGKTHSYFVQVTTEGVLFNPLDGMASLTQRDRDRRGPKYVFRPCGENCYQTYVNFLTTKNKANLLVAQRAFYDERK